METRTAAERRRDNVVHECRANKAATCEEKHRHKIGNQTTNEEEGCGGNDVDQDRDDDVEEDVEEDSDEATAFSIR